MIKAIIAIKLVKKVIGLTDFLENAVNEELTKDVDGISFFIHMRGNGQDTDKLVSDVRSLMVEHNLSVSEAKGFCEYMKIILGLGAKLHSQK